MAEKKKKVLRDAREMNRKAYITLLSFFLQTNLLEKGLDGRVDKSNLLEKGLIQSNLLKRFNPN